VTGIFKTKNPANIFLLLLFGVLLKLPLFRNAGFEQPQPGDGLLYKGLIDFLKPATASIPKLFSFLAFALLFVQALMLNRVMNSQRMTGRPTYLPAMAYLMVTSLLPVWNKFSAPLLVNTIFIFILSVLFGTYNNDKAKGSIFNTGLAAGIASFIFFPSLVFFAWMLLALMIIRPFKLNELALCIAGLATPFYFYAAYMFITGSKNWDALFPGFSLSLPFAEQSAWIAGSTFLIVVPFLAGAYFVQNNLRKMLIQVRKGWSLLLLYILISFFIPFTGRSLSYENWIITLVPFAAFHACAYLYSTYPIIPLALFWLTTGFVLAWQYYGPAW
jgi:hypothetical protein